MSKEKRDYILQTSPFKKHILKVLKSEQYWQYYIYLFYYCEGVKRPMQSQLAICYNMITTQKVNKIVM